MRQNVALIGFGMTEIFGKCTSEIGLNDFSSGIEAHSGGQVAFHVISARFGNRPIFIAEGFGDEREDALARFDGEAFCEGFDAVIVSMRDGGICGNKADGFVVVAEVWEKGFADSIVVEGLDDEDELFLSFRIADVIGADGIEEFDDEFGEFLARDELFEGSIGPVEVFVMLSQEILEGIDAGAAESDEEAFGELFFVCIVGAVVTVDGEARNEAFWGEFRPHGCELVEVITSVGRLAIHVADFCLKFVGFFFGRGFEKTTQCVCYAHGLCSAC